MHVQPQSYASLPPDLSKLVSDMQQSGSGLPTTTEPNYFASEALQSFTAAAAAGRTTGSPSYFQSDLPSPAPPSGPVPSGSGSTLSAAMDPMASFIGQQQPPHQQAGGMQLDQR